MACEFNDEYIIVLFNSLRKEKVSDNQNFVHLVSKEAEKDDNMS